MRSPTIEAPLPTDGPRRSPCGPTARKVWSCNARHTRRRQTKQNASHRGQPAEQPYRGPHRMLGSRSVQETPREWVPPKSPNTRPSSGRIPHRRTAQGTSPTRSEIVGQSQASPGHGLRRPTAAPAVPTWRNLCSHFLSNWIHGSQDEKKTHNNPQQNLGPNQQAR